MTRARLLLLGLSVALGIAGIGTYAVGAGSSITLPSSGGSGADTTLSNLSDPTAARTNLGLGTAATTASTAYLPAYSADSWTYEWANPSGALPSGWALTQSPNAATVTYPTVGTGTAIRIVSGTSSTGYIGRTFSELTTETEWEARVEMLASTLGSNGNNYIVIRDGTKRIGVYPSSSGHVIEVSTASMARPIATGAYYILTIQRTQGYVRFWCNGDLIDTKVYSAMTTDSANPGEIRIGTAVTVTGIVSEIRSFRLKFGAINDAPPSHTLRGILRGSP